MSERLWLQTSEDELVGEARCDTMLPSISSFFVAVTCFPSFVNFVVQSFLQVICAFIHAHETCGIQSKGREKRKETILLTFKGTWFNVSQTVCHCFWLNSLFTINSILWLPPNTFPSKHKHGQQKASSLYNNWSKSKFTYQLSTARFSGSSSEINNKGNPVPCTPTV